MHMPDKSKHAFRLHRAASLPPGCYRHITIPLVHGNRTDSLNRHGIESKHEMKYPYIQEFVVTMPAAVLLAASLQATFNRGALSLYRANHDPVAYGHLESAAAMNVASCDRLLLSTS
jgi:hypothetical protein